VPLGLKVQGSFARTVHEEWHGFVGVIPTPINKETGKNRGLRCLRIACLLHSWVPTRQRRAPVFVQNAGPRLQLKGGPRGRSTASAVDTRQAVSDGLEDGRVLPDLRVAGHARLG
jgi:hypothetical protein